jgi:predicted permease
LSRAAPEAFGQGLTFEVGLPAIGFAAGLLVVIGALIGSLPVWSCASADLQMTLGAAGAKGTDVRGTARLRGAAIVLQTSLAVALLICAALLVQSMALIAKSTPGFDKDGVLTFKLLIRDQYGDRTELSRLYARVLEGIGAVPGVESAAILNDLPGFDPTWQTDIAPEVNGEYQRVAPGELINVDWGIVSADYFATLGIPLQRGRAFTPREAQEGAPVMVIGASLAARFWPNGDALGRHIKYDSAQPIEIIGVAADVRTYGDERLGRAKIYTPFGRFPALRVVTIALRVSNVDPHGLAVPLTAAVRAADASVPAYDFATLEEGLARNMTPRTLTTWIVGLFAEFAVFLAGLGIHGVMSYAVMQRTREVGIRVALGARPRDVLGLVLRRGIALSVAGIALGSLLGLGMARPLAGMLFGVGPASAPAYAAGTSLFLVVAAIACVIPARRALKLDPSAALRYE